MQQWLQKMAYKVAMFMQGRYGPDQLNNALLILSMIIALVCAFVPYGWIGSIVAALLIVLCVLRMFSKNTSARFKENYRFLKLWNPVKFRFQQMGLSIKYGKKNRYFCCPKCGRIACIPKKTGKVTITCKGCKHKYDRKA